MTTPSTPTVLTVILNYRTPELTLKSLAATVRDMDGIAGEIVVVDNGSNDGSCEMIAQAIADNDWGKDNRVQLRPAGRNGGFGAGNNFAMKQGLADGSAPDFIYVLNSDAWPDPGAIAALLAFMRNTPEAGIAGSHIRGEDDAPHHTAFRFPSMAGEFEGAVRTGFVTRLFKNAVVPLGIPKEATQVDWVAGASVMFRQTMLDDIGYFDETFFLYYEETDLCRRAARARWQVWYVPDSRVVHVGSVSTGMKQWKRTPKYWFQSRRHYFVKNHGRVYTALTTLVQIAGASIWRLRKLVTHRPLGDPPHFLRDLISFSLMALFTRHAVSPDTNCAQTVAEDVK